MGKVAAPGDQQPRCARPRLSQGPALLWRGGQLSHRLQLSRQDSVQVGTISRQDSVQVGTISKQNSVQVGG